VHEAVRNRRRRVLPEAAWIQAPDGRRPSEKDRDRILYTSTFRRLAGVTQVVAPLEGHVYHNRLTHTLEVAQVARRLAERIKCEHDTRILEDLGGLDPEVVEAAALAHDLGHPPFGHVAEVELNQLAIEAGEQDGFEGNAQSFRIVTHLATHRADGLNLTRATLNAVLKYPCYRDLGVGVEEKQKYGAYRSEREDFDFAREGTEGIRQSLEAAIMDHADAIAYSIHDMEDFYRAGLIPLERFYALTKKQLLDFPKEWGGMGGKITSEEIATHEPVIRNMLDMFPSKRYTGTYEQRSELRSITSRLIGEFLGGAILDPELWRTDAKLKIDPLVDLRMRFLQGLVWEFVINNPRLATQQQGQRQIIRTLFAIYKEAVETGKKGRRLLPPAFYRLMDMMTAHRLEAHDTAPSVGRLAVDIVASFTDQQAHVLYRRLTGNTPGSVHDFLEG
jgi:dGTPase